MSYNLFLDDSRFPQNVKWVDLPPVQWTIVRNYEQFVKTIEERGLPTHISFDHDIYPEHYSAFATVNNTPLIEEKVIHYERFKEKCGWHCAKWLANYCLDKKVKLPLYYLHSLNGVGCANIFSVLESARKAMENL